MIRDDKATKTTQCSNMNFISSSCYATNTCHCVWKMSTNGYANYHIGLLACILVSAITTHFVYQSRSVTPQPTNGSSVKVCVTDIGIICNSTALPASHHDSVVLICKQYLHLLLGNMSVAFSNRLHHTQTKTRNKKVKSPIVVLTTRTYIDATDSCSNN